MMNTRKHCYRSFAKSYTSASLCFMVALMVAVLLGGAAPFSAPAQAQTATDAALDDSQLSPDLRIAKQSAEALLLDRAVNLLDVNVAVSQGAISLDGTVNSFYEKARAEELVERVEGVTTVTNNLHVRSARTGTDEQRLAHQNRGE